MLYYLFKYLDRLDFPAAGVFQFLSFRAALAVMISLLISLVFGSKLIDLLRKKLIGETVRDLGLKGQKEKQGTPTMGGLIILASIVVPTILCAKLENSYIILMLITTVVLGAVGFLDDYIKVFKKNKEGLSGKFKIVGQIGIGLLVGCTLYFSDATQVKKEIHQKQINSSNIEELKSKWMITDQPITSIPFIKNNEFNYAWITQTISTQRWVSYALYCLVIIFIVTAVSNGANLTDGLDGLATGSSAIIGIVLAVFAYLSGNYIFADYLNIMFIPGSGELVIFMGAFIGACIGFLWHNSYPAQVFMGDTGSLALGGIIAVFAIAIRKELLIPIFCGIFLAENLSVVLQVAYFKYSKKKYGAGRRILLMSPLHHHYQKKGLHEAKIVARFWIIGIILAVISIATLKLR